MAQNLSVVQRQFVQTVVRPGIEYVIGVHSHLDGLVLEMNNQQEPIQANSQVLNDGPNGNSPREDAPTLTGNDVDNLLSFVTGMRDQISETALQQLVQKAVRDVNVIRQEGA